MDGKGWNEKQNITCFKNVCQILISILEGCFFMVVSFCRFIYHRP